MSNPLRKLIREAFNEAIRNFGRNRAKLVSNPEEKIAADKILAQIIARPDLALKYKWSPEGSAGLNKNQLNYIINHLFELYHSTKDEKYKKIISYIYSPFKENGQNPPIYNVFLQKLGHTTALERLWEKDPEIFEELLAKSWGRLFAGGTIVPSGRSTKTDPQTGKLIKNDHPWVGKRVDMFDWFMTKYDPAKDSEATVIAFLYDDVINLIRKESRKDSTVSIDAPMQGSGKSHDLGDDSEDFGSDVASAEDDETLASHIGDTGSEKNIGGYKNPALKMEKFKKAIKEIVDTARAEGIGNEGALLTLEEVALRGTGYNEIAQKYPDVFAGRKPNDLLRDLIFKNKKFQELSNTILNQYDLPSLMDVNLQYIFKGEKELASIQNPTDGGEEDDQETDDSSYTFEQFVSNNMDKIMERVYKRLKNKINN